jgi:hypothetical protein
MPHVDRATETVLVFVPLSRGRAATQAVLWTVPSLLLGAATIIVYQPLQFAPTVVSSHIVDYAIAVAALPLPALSVLSAIRAVQHLLAVIWFSKLGVYASEGLLALRFGPFGTVEYPAKELDIRYPFELSGDFEDGGFEQYLPEEEQIGRLLPRITHPQAKLPINRTILRYVAGDETDIAAKLRPMIECWRTEKLEGASFPSPCPLA